MTSQPSILATDETTCAPGYCRGHHFLCWGAVLAGTISALGIYLLLALMGIGSGLAPFRSVSDAPPAANFSVGAAIAWSLFAVIAWSWGGWVAGRVGGYPRKGLGLGFLVWSLTVSVTLPLLALGGSREWNRAVKPHAENMDINHQAVVFAEHDAAKAMAQRSREQLLSFSEEAGESVPTNATPKAATRARREVGFEVDKLFAPGNAAGFQTNRQEAVNVLMAYTEMNAADATATITDWTVSHANLEAELDKLSAELSQARAERARVEILVDQAAQADADVMIHARLRAAKWAFFALLIGLAGATLGGWCGGEGASRKAGSQRVKAASV